MFGIGMPELVIILVVALIVIGPQKLPELARSLGRALGEFKRATNDLKDSLGVDQELEDVKKAFTGLNDDIRDVVRGGATQTGKQAGSSTLAIASDGDEPAEAPAANADNDGAVAAPLTDNKATNPKAMEPEDVSRG